MSPESLPERVAILKEQVRGLLKNVEEIETELHGRQPGSVRGRLHTLEGDSAAAKHAKTALDQARVERSRRGDRIDRRAGWMIVAIVAVANGAFFLLDRLIG